MSQAGDDQRVEALGPMYSGIAKEVGCGKERGPMHSNIKVKEGETLACAQDGLTGEMKREAVDFEARQGKSEDLKKAFTAEGRTPHVEQTETKIASSRPLELGRPNEGLATPRWSRRADGRGSGQWSAREDGGRSSGLSREDAATSVWSESRRDASADPSEMASDVLVVMLDRVEKPPDELNVCADPSGALMVEVSGELLVEMVDHLKEERFDEFPEVHDLSDEELVEISCSSTEGEATIVVDVEEAQESLGRIIKHAESTDSYSSPTSKEMLDPLIGKKYFATPDMLRRFRQSPIDPG